MTDAELREAIARTVVGWLAKDIPDETTELVHIKHDEWQKLYADLEALFILSDLESTVQLRKDNAFIKALKRDVQQQLLTELLDDGWHYHRTCLSCGKNWWGLHCPHDGYQNPCPACGAVPVQVLLNPIKSDTCGCEFVIPVSAIEAKLKNEYIIGVDFAYQNKTNDGGTDGGL